MSCHILQETVFNEECLSKSFLSGCIPTVNCFPLDLVHIIDSMIWLNEKPVALLANVRPLSLFKFSSAWFAKTPLTGMPSG